MVKTSGIRERLRSNVLKELAKERQTKRNKSTQIDIEDPDDSEEEERERLNRERMIAKAKCSNSSLISLLPKPKNSSVFGPTVKLDKLLKMPERAKISTLIDQSKEDRADRVGEDGMIEVDVGKMMTDVSQILIRDLTVEKSRNTVIVPKGKEKQKNQITYLAQLGKANELERKEQAALSRINKAAARSKYGW